MPAGHGTTPRGIYCSIRRDGKEVRPWGRNWCCLGICALALGLAIFIVAIFPVGFLMFLVALLLVVCGWGCIRRRVSGFEDRGVEVAQGPVRVLRLLFGIKDGQE